MEEIGLNPARIIAAWADALDEATADGRTLRGVGEPAWYGRRDLELIECQLHELLLNRAFDDGPGVAPALPLRRVAAPARRCATSPWRPTPSAPPPPRGGPSDRYVPDGDLVAFAAPLARPREGVLRGVFRGAHDIPATRHTVAQYARTCGLPEEQVEALQLAASELATNSVRYGGGSGTVAMWVQEGAAVVEFTDAGHVTDPLTGRLTPSLRAGGRPGPVPRAPALRPGAAALLAGGHHGPRRHLAVTTAAATSAVEVLPCTPDRWPDVVAVFEGPGDPGRCWCQWFYRGGQRRQRSTPTPTARHCSAQVEERPPGVLGYLDGTPAGWCAIAPRPTLHPADPVAAAGRHRGGRS